MDSTLRTFRFALAARLTLGRVDVCQVVFERDCFERTNLHTLATTDTARLTCLVGNGTLVLVDTHYHHTTVVLTLRTDFDDAARTSLGTSATSGTLFFVHFRQACFRIHADSIELTCSHTVTTTLATKCTACFTTRCSVGNRTRLCTVVLSCTRTVLTTTVTSHYRNLRF